MITIRIYGFNYILFVKDHLAFHIDILLVSAAVLTKEEACCYPT